MRQGGQAGLCYSGPEHRKDTGERPSGERMAAQGPRTGGRVCALGCKVEVASWEGRTKGREGLCKLSRAVTGAKKEDTKGKGGTVDGDSITEQRTPICLFLFPSCFW